MLGMGDMLCLAVGVFIGLGVGGMLGYFMGRIDRSYAERESHE